MGQNNNTADREIVITRILNAPQALVFDVWTDARHIGNWWGPNGFTITTHEISIKPGGVWRFIMHGPDGVDYANRIVFDKIDRPAMISYVHDSDKDNDPAAFRSVITFENMGDKTKLTLRTLFATAAIRNMVVEKYHAIEGGNQTISRFAEQLEKRYTEPDAKDTFVISREFNAPRELVFKAFTEAERLAQWWGPVGFAMGHVSLDLRPGGRFHYSMKAGDVEMWGLFHYHEVTPPSRLVFTNSFSDKDGNVTRAPFNPSWPLEVMNVLTLKENGNKTILTLSGGPYNATLGEVNIFMENFGNMNKGFAGTFDQLDAYLASIK